LIGAIFLDLDVGNVRLYQLASFVSLAEACCDDPPLLVLEVFGLWIDCSLLT